MKEMHEYLWKCFDCTPGVSVLPVQTVKYRRWVNR